MKKILSVHNIGLMLVLALISVFTLKAANVKAAGTVTWNGTNKVTIDRKIENVVNAPVVSYTYTVTPAAGNPDGATGAPTTASIAFAGSETVTANAVEKTAELSFAGMGFTKPGDYTYTLTETATSNNSYPVDSTRSYTVIVSVRNDVDGSNVPTGNFTASLVLKDSQGAKIEGVSGNPPVAQFISSPDNSNFGRIVVTETVKGTTADVNEYFPVTITLSDTTHTYPISVPEATITYNGSTVTQPTEITNGTATVYLKHGQTATIGRSTDGTSSFDTIPTGTTYSVSETATGYTSTYALNGGTPTSGTSTSNQTLASGANTVDFVNTKSSSPITGIITTVVPYILLVVIAVCGTLIYTTLKGKKQEM